MTEHIILAMMLVGQMVIGAISLAYIVREVKSVERAVETAREAILKKLD